MKFQVSFLFILTVFLPTVSSSVTWTLFEEGQQVSSYNWILRDLMSVKEYQEPVFLKFDQEEPIEITSFLGHGGLTAVFLRKDGRALRIPLAKGNAFFRRTPQDEFVDYGPFTFHMLDYFKAMTKIGKLWGIAPKIFLQDSNPPKYITVEYFPAKFNIHDFYFRRDELISSGKLQVTEAQDLELQLIQFVIRLAVFQHIGDFKTQQLVSDGTRWRLLDASEKVIYANKWDDPTVFDHRNMGPKLPSEVYEMINTKIRDYRQKYPNLLQRNQITFKSCKDIFR